jgi:hypothetical protein
VSDPTDPQLGPEQEAEVRRLLAGARHDEPVPHEVAARLDRVLADLVGEPAREATVVRLAHRRRRVATMLLAAAAVVVGGFGVGQLLDGVGGSDSGESATSAEDAPADEESAFGGSAESEDGGGAAAEPPADAEVVRVRPATFAEDVALLRTRAVSQSSGQSGAAPDTLGEARASLAVCGPGDWGRGRYLPVQYGRAAGYVVLRRPRGDTQVADLFLCGSDRVVRSVTLPSR